MLTGKTVRVEGWGLLLPLMGINDAGMKTDAFNPPQYSHRSGAKQASGGPCGGFQRDPKPGPARSVPSAKLLSAPEDQTSLRRPLRRACRATRILGLAGKAVRVQGWGLPLPLIGMNDAGMNTDAHPTREGGRGLRVSGLGFGVRG